MAPMTLGLGMGEHCDQYLEEMARYLDVPPAKRMHLFMMVRAVVAEQECAKSGLEREKNAIQREKAELERELGREKLDLQKRLADKTIEYNEVKSALDQLTIQTDAKRATWSVGGPKNRNLTRQRIEGLIEDAQRPASQQRLLSVDCRSAFAALLAFEESEEAKKVFMESNRGIAPERRMINLKKNMQSNNYQFDMTRMEFV